MSRRRLFGAAASTAAVGATAGLVPPRAAAAVLTDPATLYQEGDGGYGSFRIPAILHSRNGTLLAFCEMRHTFGDSGDINIGLRRSTDGGQTWTPPQVVTSLATDTAGNPCVMQSTSGDIVLLSCRNRGQDT